MTELKRAHGLGKLRVRGLAQVIACNIKRWAKAAKASPMARLHLQRLVFRLIKQLGAVRTPRNGLRRSIAEFVATLNEASA